MAKLPGAEDIGGVPSGRSGRPIASYDTSAIGRGVAQFGAGIRQLGGDLQVAAERRAKEKETVSQADQFETQRRFLEFKSAQETALQDAGKQEQPGAFGFKERYQSEYLKAAKQFMSSVPDPLKAEYDVRLFQAEDGLVAGAGKFEQEQRKGYYTNAVNDGLSKIENELYANPKSYDQALKDGDAYIASLPDEDVSPIEKDALKRSWKEKAQLASLNGMNPEDRKAALGVGVTIDVVAGVSGVEGAKALLRKKESFRAKPYWDVNAYRIGFGSDTITKADGSIVKVTQGMTVTREDAERDLSRRVAEFQRVAIGQVGQREWAGLSPAAQSALTSVTYNYGSLPAPVVNAIKAGDISGVASAVEGLQGHNNGINRKRRLHEAAIIRGGGGPVEGETAAVADPRFADVPWEKQQVLLAKADAEIVQQQQEADVQVKAQRAAVKDTLSLGIETGDVVSQEQILSAEVDDGDKAILLKALATKTKDTGEVNAAVAAFAQGGLGVDPYSSEGKNLVDRVWDKVEKAAPEQSGAMLDQIVRQTETVPAPVLNAIRRGLASTDPAEFVPSIQQASRISQINPSVLGRRDGGDGVQRSVDDFSHYVNGLNLSPEDAAKRMIDANDPAKKQQRKALEPAAKEFLKTEAETNVAAAFDTFWSAEPSLGFTPQQAAGIQADYLAIAEDAFYTANGDPELAKSRAMAEFKRLYGVTEFSGGKAVVKHPPENYWPASIHGTKQSEATGFLFQDRSAVASLDYARTQLEADIKALSPDIDAGTIRLVTTPETDAMVKRGELPAYGVIYQDKDGMYQTMPGKLWRPDVTMAVEWRQRADERDAQSAMDNARQQQKQDTAALPYRQRATPQEILSGQDGFGGDRDAPTPPIRRMTGSGAKF